MSATGSASLAAKNASRSKSSCSAISAAQSLYRETDASRNARVEAAERRRLERTGYAKPPTKPDKRARRLIIALGDIDAM